VVAARINSGLNQEGLIIERRRGINRLNVFVSTFLVFLKYSWIQKDLIFNDGYFC